MSMTEGLHLSEAAILRELLTEEAKTAYRAERDPEKRAMLYAELRQIAKKGRLTREFDLAFQAFKKTVEAEERAADSKKRVGGPQNENLIRFEALENPYPALQSYTYAIRDDGVFLGKDRICTQPVLLYEKLRNIESGEDSFCIAWFDGFQWMRRVERREVLFSTSQIIHLAAYGLSVHSANAQRFIRFLDTFERENQAALKPKMSVSRLGWFDGGRFAPYDSAMAFDGTANRDLYDSVAEKGNPAEWIARMRELRVNLPLRLAMAASFASPLIRQVHALPFIFHIWGPSGAGKTVALMVAMSVWGNPAFGHLLRTLNATTNYLVNTATFFCSIPVAYDELQITGSQFSNLEALVMMLTEGLNRGRMKYDEARKVLPWNCCFLFSGEGPVTTAGSGGGVFNRLIEVECRGSVVADGNATVSLVQSNYGHAGRVYVDYIRNRDVKSLYRQQEAELLRQVKTTGKQASSMALMLIADKLAGECLFPGETPLTVRDVKPYLKTETDVDISQRAYEYICGVIAANRSRFETDSRGAASNYELWGRIGGNICTFNKVKLEAVLKEGQFSFDAVKRRWAENGCLLKNSAGKFIHDASYNGVKARSVKLVLPGENSADDADAL